MNRTLKSLMKWFLGWLVTTICLTALITVFLYVVLFTGDGTPRWKASSSKPPSDTDWPLYVLLENENNLKLFYIYELTEPNSFFPPWQVRLPEGYWAPTSTHEGIAAPFDTRVYSLSQAGWIHSMEYRPKLMPDGAVVAALEYYEGKGKIYTSRYTVAGGIITPRSLHLNPDATFVMLALPFHSSLFAGAVSIVILLLIRMFPAMRCGPS